MLIKVQKPCRKQKATVSLEEETPGQRAEAKKGNTQNLEDKCAKCIILLKVRDVFM